MAELKLHTTEKPLEDAARFVANALTLVGPRARLGVAGGSALGALGLVRAQLAPALWKSLRLTFVDERLVPFDDPASTRGEAHRQGALSAEQPPGVELALVQDGESLEHAVNRVSLAFSRDFDGELDVVLLGIGEDGHVASLFPGHPALESSAPVLAVDDSPKPPPQRVTLGLTVLARPGLSRVLVAMGAAKRAALGGVLLGDSAIPASRLGALTVVTDQRLT